MNLSDLSPSDLAYLTYFGDPILQLYKGQRIPRTPAQEKFLRVCQMLEPATEPHEFIFLRFLQSGLDLSDVRLLHEVERRAYLDELGDDIDDEEDDLY